MCKLTECPGIFLPSAKCHLYLFEVGTLLQIKITREGIRCVDITGGYRK